MRTTIFDQLAVRLPFHLRGQEGTVSVYYGANDDPERWGFAWLQLPFDLELVRGFPVCQAVIDFPGPGYQAVMGWIQLITVQEAETEHTWVSVDQPPNHWGVDVPFVEFGYLPTLFDAPGPNPPRANETWRAETFLVYSPDIARTRSVAELLGFQWGYRLQQMQPTLLPVEPVSPSPKRRSTLGQQDSLGCLDNPVEVVPPALAGQFLLHIVPRALDQVELRVRQPARRTGTGSARPRHCASAARVPRALRSRAVPPKDQRCCR